MSRVAKLLTGIAVVVVAVAALNWFLIRQRSSDLQAVPDRPAAGTDTTPPLELREVEAPALREIEPHPVEKLQAAPPPSSEPKVVIPMSEITFERSGGTVIGGHGSASPKPYDFSKDSAAEAGKQLAKRTEARAKSLIPGCWYRDERGVIDHVHATFELAGSVAARTCVNPSRHSPASGKTVHVLCAGSEDPWNLDLSSAAEAVELDAYLLLSADAPDRTWLRKEDGRPLTFQLQLEGTKGLTGITCLPTGDGRDCCGDRPWPNLDP